MIIGRQKSLEIDSYHVNADLQQITYWQLQHSVHNSHSAMGAYDTQQQDKMAACLLALDVLTFLLVTSWRLPLHCATFFAAQYLSVIHSPSDVLSLSHL